MHDKPIEEISTGQAPEREEIEPTKIFNTKSAN